LALSLGTAPAVHADSRQDSQVSPAQVGDAKDDAQIPPAENVKTEAVEIPVELQVFRDGLLDPQARPEGRERWAKALCVVGTEPAAALITQMLRQHGRPEVQRALLNELYDIERLSALTGSSDLALALVEVLSQGRDDLWRSASHLLGLLDDDRMISRLGGVARNESLAVDRRKSALDAFARNVHKRVVLNELIATLDSSNKEVVDHAMTILRHAAPEPVEASPEAWKYWWSTQDDVGDETRLAYQSQFYRSRYQELAEEFEQYRIEVQGQLKQRKERLELFQRRLFRTLSNDEDQRATLEEWLGDPLPEIVRTALSIIKGNLADEGKPPSGTMLDALLALLNDGDVELRREVLLIVQNVSTLPVLEEVLKQLQVEQDAKMRLAILKAVGELNLPQAVPALIEELQSPTSTDECVKEAALALDGIFANSTESTGNTSVNLSLKARYSSTAEDNIELRSALLAAMAGVGDSDFESEFLAALEEEPSQIIRPAIRGLSAIGNREKLTRIRELTAHSDGLVRLAAIEAVHKLGNETADFECLLIRINPANEDYALARDSAWKAIRDYLDTQSFGEKVAAAERLRDQPDRELEFLDSLAAAMDGVPEDIVAGQKLLGRLADLCENRQEYVRAAGYLRKLYRLRASNDDTSAVETALRWLRISLEHYPQTDPTEVVLAILETDHDVKDWDQFVAALKAFSESNVAKQDPKRMERLVNTLKGIDNETISPRWNQLLQEWRDRLVAAIANTPDDQSTNGGKQAG
jgi:HEAT repeat protein